MKAKHTPGPWAVKPGGTDISLRIIGKTDLNQELIASVPTYGDGHANARLMAAAPELLDALKGVLIVADRKTNEFDAARAAIAKAEGKQ